MLNKKNYINLQVFKIRAVYFKMRGQGSITLYYFAYKIVESLVATLKGKLKIIYLTDIIISLNYKCMYLRAYFANNNIN